MKSDYIHVKKFISDDVADLLYGHVLLAHSRLRVMLDDKDFCKKYPNEKNIPRPKHWSRWNLNPYEIEFWLDGKDRIHERLLYSRVDSNKWEKNLLSP